MRLRFSDESRTLKEAEKDVDTGYAQLRYWWTEKYKLPATHPLFQDSTPTELYREWCENLLIERKAIMRQLDNAESSQQEKALIGQLNQINESLGYTISLGTDDDWFDQMEKELEKGTLDMDKV